MLYEVITAVGKRPVGDHRDALLERERQEALLRLALIQRIVDLHEIPSYNFV